MTSKQGENFLIYKLKTYFFFFFYLIVK